jgi:hypothetical protein
VTNEKVMERQQLLRLLLTRGARVEGIDYCSSPDDGDCYKVLLPILQDFNTRRSASAQSF